jgi:hypothetical protein
VITIKVSGDSNFTKCTEDVKSQLFLCACKTDCRRIQLSEGSNKLIKNQTFFIFNLAKSTNDAICPSNIVCQNSRNVSFEGKIVEVMEEPLEATSVIEMVILQIFVTRPVLYRFQCFKYKNKSQNCKRKEYNF